MRFSAAGVRDKVQAMRVWERGRPLGITSHPVDSIVPALAKSARTGHPQFRVGKKKQNRRPGHPPDRGKAQYEQSHTAVRDRGPRDVDPRFARVGHCERRILINGA